jgi:hypothetical protein
LLWAALLFGQQEMEVIKSIHLKRIKLLVISTTVLIVALLYFFLDARNAGIFPHCPFNSITGLFCPGCGSQRAVSALLHGELLQALSFNILLVFSMPLVLYSAMVSIANNFTKKQWQQKLFYSPLFVKVFLFVVIAFGVGRNIPLYPFTLLAPH